MTDIEKSNVAFSCAVVVVTLAIICYILFDFSIKLERYNFYHNMNTKVDALQQENIMLRDSLNTYREWFNQAVE